jgi:hypothetical protein
MKIIENANRETVKEIIKSGKNFLAVSSIYTCDRIAVYQIYKVNNDFYVFLDFELNFCSNEANGVNNKSFEEKYLNEKLYIIFWEVDFLKIHYNVDFVFLEMEPEESYKIKVGDGMSFENIIRSVFEKGFFPKKYFELEIEKK